MNQKNRVLCQEKTAGGSKDSEPPAGLFNYSRHGRVNILPVFTMSWYSDNNYSLTT